MHLAVVISIILIIFMISFVSIWTWFFKNEQNFCEQLYILGIEALKAGHFKRAKSYFHKIITIIPNYKDAKFKQCITLIKMEDFENAEIELSAIIKDEPKNYEFQLELAALFGMQNKYEQAETEYLNALKINEKSFECNYELGKIKYGQKLFNEALDYFEKAKGLSENEDSNLEFFIISCNDELCDYENEDKAIEIINRYIEMENKGNTPDRFNTVVAKAYSKLGEIEQAETYCNRALAINPESIENYKIMSIIKLIKKDYVSAKTLLTTGLKLQPKNKELHDILSYALCYQVDNCTIDRCREKFYELISNFLK